MLAASPGPLVNTTHASLNTAGLAFGSGAGSMTIGAGYGLRSPLWVGLAMAGLLSLIPFIRDRPVQTNGGHNGVRPCRSNAGIFHGAHK